MNEQTWYNLRVEYIDELTHQFHLREKLELMKQSSIVEESKILQTEKLIENSCKRCRCFDHIISESANQFKS